MPLALDISTDLAGFNRMGRMLTDALEQPTAESSPLRAALEEQAHAYAVETQNRFNRASGGDGTWIPLKPATIKKKARKTLFPDRILYLTGEMYLSLIEGQPNNVFEFGTDRLAYGTRDRKAGYHQVGNPRRNLPARPILVPPSAEVLRLCDAVMSASWQELVNNATGTRPA